MNPLSGFAHYNMNDGDEYTIHLYVPPLYTNHNWMTLYMSMNLSQPQTVGECAREQVLAEVNQYLHYCKHMNCLNIIKQYPMETFNEESGKHMEGSQRWNQFKSYAKLTTSMSCGNTLMSWNGGMMWDESTVDIS